MNKVKIAEEYFKVDTSQYRKDELKSDKAKINIFSKQS